MLFKSKKQNCLSTEFLYRGSKRYTRSDPDRSLVLSNFLTNFLQNLASCHTAFNDIFFLLYKKWVMFSTW
jgi:hypothetical protein